MSESDCPDCGEPLAWRRGRAALAATLYCPSCLWCERSDGDRQEDAREDWRVRNARGGMRDDAS